MPAITALRFTLSRKLNHKTFLKGNWSSWVFRFPCLKSRNICLAESSSPDYGAKTLSSSLSDHLIYLPCYETNPRSNTFIWKFVHYSRFLCKTIFIFATPGRISDCRKCDHTLLAPDLKSQHRRILAIFSFILTTTHVTQVLGTRLGLSASIGQATTRSQVMNRG